MSPASPCLDAAPVPWQREGRRGGPQADCVEEVSRVRNPILSSMPSHEERGGAILFRSELHRRIDERCLGKRVNSSVP